MEYIKRELERKFLEVNKLFKAVLVIGARQVGKSTMLRHPAKEQNRTIVTMKDTWQGLQRMTRKTAGNICRR